MDAANTTAFDIGSYFINQYYQVLSSTPESTHQFYNESSTMTRVDGDDTQTVTTLLDIHTLLTSLSVTNVEVKHLIAHRSWDRGILLIVYGIARSRNFYGKRKFSQVFFLAPQDNGFFVRDDVLQFQDEEVVNQHPVPELPDVTVDSEVHGSNSHLVQQVSNYELEEETREYVNSLQIEDDSPIDKYSLPDEQPHEDLQSETVVKEATVEEYSPLESVNYVEDPAPAPTPAPASAPVDEPASEPAGERAKLSYASILQASKGQSVQPSRQAAARQSLPPPPSVEQRMQANSQQLNASASSFMPEVAGTGADDGFQEEEPISVYVRSLPSNVTNADLEKEFKNFGKIKPNGIFILNKKEIGVCYAFVEYEDMSSVHTAIKASPIEIFGRQVYIEERRRGSSTNSARGGAVPRGRGRGRTSYQNESSRGRGGVRNPGRGSASDSNRYNGVRGNGYQQRPYQ